MNKQQLLELAEFAHLSFTELTTAQPVLAKPIEERLEKLLHRAAVARLAGGSEKLRKVAANIKLALGTKPNQSKLGEATLKALREAVANDRQLASDEELKKELAAREKAAAQAAASGARPDVTLADKLGLNEPLAFNQEFRLIMIMWALAGLLAIALYAGQISDPDLIWGYMTQKLLFPGAVGLMLIGILAANMSTLDATSISYSALFIKNLYEPFYPGKSEKHKILVGKLVIPVTLEGGILVALYVDNLLELFKYIISVPAIFGAALWLGFIWRRLTKWAVIIQVVLCLFIYAIIPILFLELDSFKYNEKLLKETNHKNVGAGHSVCTTRHPDV